MDDETAVLHGIALQRGQADRLRDQRGHMMSRALLLDGGDPRLLRLIETIAWLDQRIEAIGQ